MSAPQPATSAHPSADMENSDQPAPATSTAPAETSEPTDEVLLNFSWNGKQQENIAYLRRTNPKDSLLVCMRKVWNDTQTQKKFSSTRSRENGIIKRARKFVETLEQFDNEEYDTTQYHTVAKRMRRAKTHAKKVVDALEAVQSDDEDEETTTVTIRVGQNTEQNTDLPDHLS